ncbi:MAG TPA: SIMPL domain-containing protein [Bryobacteraceae bacterium]|nr:SIMPL domain-containing protein [Bryobacteraceae bacterium]
MPGLVLTAILFCAAIFAQVDPYTVTVTATETLNVQPDQAVIAGYFETALSGNLNDVVSALQPAGITAANVTGITTVNGGFTPNPNAIVWSFTLAVPLTSLNSTLAALGQLQQTLSKPNTGLNNLYFSVQGLQVSPQLRASQQCPVSALLASAQAQALAIAQAAGFGLGPLLAISDGSLGAYATAPNSFATGYFFPALEVGPVIQTPIVCAVVAKFSLIIAP